MISKSRIGEIMIYMITIPMLIVGVIGLVLGAIQHPIEMGFMFALIAIVLTGAYLTKR